MKYKIKYYSRQRKDRTVVLFINNDWRFFDTDGVETNENRDTMIDEEKLWIETILLEPEKYLNEQWIALIPCEGYSFNEIVPAITRGAFFRRKEWKEAEWARKSLIQWERSARRLGQSSKYTFELFDVSNNFIVKIKDFDLSPKEMYMEDWIISQPDLMDDSSKKEKSPVPEKEQEDTPAKEKKDDWEVTPAPGEVIPHMINGYYVHRKITNDMFIVYNSPDGKKKGANYIVVNKDGKPYFENWYQKIILVKWGNPKDIRFIASTQQGTVRHDMILDKNERILFGKNTFVHLNPPQNNSNYLSVYDENDKFIGTYSIEHNRYYPSQEKK